jgi:N,N'-diacetylchitobiose transport system permease protein
MPSGPASPGRRWLSPPAAGARPGQRGRPGWSARAGALLRNFVAAVPRDLAEAASIDGAGPARVLWRILFPLVAPGLVATSIFSFITAWNEFIFALTFLGNDQSKFTLQIYVQFFFARGTADWGAIMAASTLYMIPVMVFFLFVQRRMVGGLVAGAVKG